MRWKEAQCFVYKEYREKQGLDGATADNWLRATWQNV
jgi:hypothetical protein